MGAGTNRQEISSLKSPLLAVMFFILNECMFFIERRMWK